MKCFYSQRDVWGACYSCISGSEISFRRWSLYLSSSSPRSDKHHLSVFQAILLLLWPPQCPATTWPRLILPRSSESCSLILPTLCPTSLHNLPSPNFPYRSHWLSFVCVWKAYPRLLARGCMPSTERTAPAPLISHEARGGLSSQV